MHSALPRPASFAPRGSLRGSVKVPGDKSISHRSLMLSALAIGESRVDLVLSDMKMPQMSGAELLTEVARLYPATYRIILSGYADMASTLAAVNQGQIHRYLQKPWHQQDLLTALRDGLDKVALQQRNTELQQQLQLRNQQLEQFNQQLAQFSQFNDPNGVYSYCVSCSIN